MPGIGAKTFNRNTQAPRSDSQSNDSHYPRNVSYQPVSPYTSYPSTSSQLPPSLVHDHSISGSQYVATSAGTSDFNVPSTTPIQQLPPALPPMTPAWNGALFDPNDPSLFNFDLASMNFASNYGALEFGMLGHMATGAGDTPSDSGTQRGSVGQPTSDQYGVPLGSLGESPSTQHAFTYGSDGMLPDWQRNQNFYSFQQKFEPPHAFAIESNHAQFMSPDNNGDMKLEDSPTMTQTMFKPTSFPNPMMNPQPNNNAHSTPAHVRQPGQISTPQLKAKSQIPAKSSRRMRDPSAIYSTVTSPHPYTTGFHALIAYFQRRFASTPAKTLTIAKCLASIRPSFIATTKTLSRDDLIFMEKCFQRTLWEYEGFIEGVGTPTIVARRTGEIAAVGKEFEILTGWTKRVLLGKAPNLNVNRGRSAGSSSAGGTGPGSGANTTGRGTGLNTPVRASVPAFDGDGERSTQPVFLAELLDDESVVTFYEDFARLAFGDSRGSVMGRAKLLKYQTQEDQIASNLKREADAQRGKEANVVPTGDAGRSIARPPSMPARKSTDLKKDGIAGEKGMQRLGSVDGKVECTFCWTVKRDVFDIPMLIVMNVGSSLPPAGESVDF